MEAAPVECLTRVVRSDNTNLSIARSIRAHGSNVLAMLGLSCDNPLMTTTVDQRHRAVTPFKPGDVLEIEQRSPDVVVLKRTKQAVCARPKLVRRNRRLVFIGGATTTEEVNRLLEDFP
jgi:bifunctional DNA-binding transcriptional regulator/antitoxin component of YhaV-PrlF toxin-antitoxin module